MSPWHPCNKCKTDVIGDENYGCMVCFRRSISMNIRYDFYFKSLIGINLPNELIVIIANFASKDFDNNVAKKVNIDCWKSRMHNIIP